MRYIEDVVTLALDGSRCNGCAMCVAVCPHAVFRMEAKRAVLADRGACMECGACARNCEAGAIRVRAGVGCAAGILAGLAAGTEPTCGGCADDTSGACCS
jgi:NAD-dependent dihydropyrimidine dehydrogenase PreA subunit